MLKYRERVSDLKEKKLNLEAHLSKINKNKINKKKVKKISKKINKIKKKKR